MKTLLLEIGTEEIPARFIELAKEGFFNLLKEGLNVSRISFSNIKIQTTPRRMVAFIYDVYEKQSDSIIVKYGPPVNRAFDESGAPTKAAQGFAKSQGVAVEELIRAVKDGVEFIAVEKMEKGISSKDVLSGLFRDIIPRIPFQKKMRWGNESFEFARPLQWILALFDEEPIDFTIADVKSGNFTYGHRFLSSGRIEIARPSEYAEKMRANYIVLSEEERMGTILQGISRIEGEVHGHAIGDNDLIKEITNITEYPYPLRGEFDAKFLGIPKEVLINVMKSHQRYIPIMDERGELMPYFIFFANTVPVEDKNVIRGNEKVLRARLADAEFFFEEDGKIPLSGLYERLSSIVFHVKLGTLKQKTDRVIKIAHSLSSILGFADIEKVDRSVSMMKADLLTHMVGEFPELQGVMGRIYAGHQGEAGDVARAIEEHYLPSGGNSSLPETTLGTIISIADKIDSLTSFFSVGITPTGNLDPFALRRQALGIIKIAVDKKLHIPIEGLIETAYVSGDAINGRVPPEETRASLIDFIVTRFKFSMIEEGRNQEFVESVMPFVAKDIYDGYVRLITLETQKSIEDFKKLMVGFKRAFNITKMITEDREIKTSLFTETEEQMLFELYESSKGKFFDFMRERKYDYALSILVGFKETIDSYFDKVFVMDKDQAIKNNRLALLKKIKDMFLTFGDFSKIHIE
ncbi:MAG: glycine--tRNA ligase subunit beta [Proteobacteria bacterium]|nr:glycine--tRNA ligase subunit beta [Pseudomonadota bacterium]